VGDFDGKSKLITRSNVSHLGIILANYSLLGAAFMVAGVSIAIFRIFAILMALLLLLLTLGALWNQVKGFISGGGALDTFTSAMLALTPTVAGITLGVSAASVILLAFGDKKSKLRIIQPAIAAVIAAFGLVIYLKGAK